MFTVVESRPISPASQMRGIDGTKDGTKVQTVDESLVWIFAAVDHCDAAYVDIHVITK